MSKITLTNLINLENQTTAVNAINNNNAAIIAAINNTLSLDGTAPNQMAANLDMNSNQLLNQGTTSYTFATLPASPVTGRLAVITDGTSGLAWGAAASGGHSSTYLVWWNGSQWSVLGK